MFLLLLWEQVCLQVYLSHWNSAIHWLRLPLLRTHSYEKFCSFKPEVGQNMAFYALPAVGNSTCFISVVQLYFSQLSPNRKWRELCTLNETDTSLVSFWKFRSPCLGKATAATRAALPIPTSVCSVCVWPRCQWVGSLTCAQMLRYTIPQGSCSTIAKVSAQKVDSGEQKSLAGPKNRTRVNIAPGSGTLTTGLSRPC